MIFIHKYFLASQKKGKKDHLKCQAMPIKNPLCKSNYFFMIPLQQCRFTYTQSITFFIMLFYCRTDALFQAVHENAFEILECLLSEYKPQQQQSFYNHRHHDRHPSSINAKDYQKRQRRQKDVPAALSSSSSESEAAALPESSSSTLPPPPPHQSINIQKTTTTKGKDSRGNKAVVLNREKPSNNANNNSRSSKGHEEDDDGDSNIDDDDHVLCPFYYALNYAPSYPSKRESLVRLLQSYYKCKCLEEIASCHQNNFGGDTTHIEDEEKGKQTRNCKAVAGNQAKECWNVVCSSYVNFSGWWQWWYAKSVPPAGYGAVHVDDSVQNYRTQQYHAYDHHHYQCDPIPSTSSSVDVDNENDIKFLLPAESSGKGGEGNELCSSKLFPYKIYKIQGKCHVIKENESSSTPSPVSVSSSSPSPSTTPAATANTRTTRVHKRPSSSFVILVGPLKLSCITREVIRDQIKLCGSRGTGKIKRSCKNITTSAPANGTTREQHNEGSQRSGESTVASEPLELWLKSEDYFNKMNFRKSLETLMMPSSLMDYILYKNIHWSESRSCSTLLSSSGIRMLRRRDENEYTTAAAADENSSAAADDNVGENNELSNNIKLIKRDLELNINYFAIYIY